MSHYFLKVFPVLDWSPVNLRQTLFNFFKRLDRIFARLVKRYKKQEKITPRQKKLFQSKLTQKNRLELNYLNRSRTRFTYEREAGLPAFQLYSKYSEFSRDFAYR